MNKIRRITIEWDAFTQTLKGEAAEQWFTALVSALHRQIPLSIIMAPWKTRKKSVSKQKT
jgi:hypothetical protein